MSTKKSIYAVAVAVATAAALTAEHSFAAPEGITDTKGYWIGGVANVSPFIDANWVYDKNPNNARKQKKDIMDEQKTWDKSEGYTIRPGVNIAIPGNCWKIAGRAYYEMTRYSSSKVDDRDDWGENFTFSSQTDGGMTWNLSESLKQVDMEELFVNEPPYNYSTRDRFEAAFGGSVSKAITDKSRLGVNANYNFTDYDSEKMYDYYRYGGAINFSHVLTDKTDWNVSVAHSIHEQDYNSDAANINRVGESKANSTKLMLGAATRTTEKVSFNVGAGVEFYEGFEDRYGNSDKETTFTYHLASSWAATERLSIGLHGLGEYEVAEDVDNDSVNAKSIGLTLSYSPFNRWRLNGGITYRREDYERRVSKITAPNGNPFSADENGEKRSDDNIYVSGNIVFAITSWASVHGGITYRDVNSSIEDFNYDRTVYTLGGSLRF